MKESTRLAPQWATASGDVWSRRWPDTDRGLAGVSGHLLSAIAASSPEVPFRAFEVGCGAGSTAIAVSKALPNATVVACDISLALVSVAQQRTVAIPAIKVVLGDAEGRAGIEGPFDLIFSRHGVMFFPEPVRAFQRLRRAANPGGSLVFSCFQSWEANPWASVLASAATGRELPPPGRESGGFAFADPDYVLEIFSSSGWTEAEPQDVGFQYVAAEGDDSVEHALAFFAEIGPASRILQSLPDQERADALERMRDVIAGQFDGTAVTFPAAAWIWAAKAGPAC